MKSTFKTIGRIVIILAVAGLIIFALSALTSSTADASAAMRQPLAFDPDSAMASPAFRPEGGEAGAFGLLELVKNVGVIGLIITAYWFIQNWIGQIKRKSRLAN